MPVRVDLVVGMPNLDHLRLADGVGQVGEIGLVEVLLHLLGRGPFVPGERQIVALALEVILDVALGADQRAHLLVRRLIDVLALPRERLAQCRPGHAEPHRVRLVAIEAADRMRDLLLEIVELHGVELLGLPELVPSCRGTSGLLHVQHVAGVFSLTRFVLVTSSIAWTCPRAWR